MRVKICGITTLADAIAVCNAGAYALGFNFISKSPRYIEPPLAKEIIQKLNHRIITVGVFANSTPEEIKNIVETTGIDIVQLHGDEPINSYKHFPGLKVIKALTIDEQINLPSISLLKKYAAILIDQPKACLNSISHHVVDRKIAKELSNHVNVYFSGGINVDNVLEAVSEVNPFAIDVARGVESSPGVKCAEKMKKFFNAVNQGELS